MADKTGISWTDATWNPIVGCSVVSPGCTNCYAMRDAARIVRCSEGAGRVTHYEGTIEPSKAGPVWTGKVALAPDYIVAKPLSWRRPRRIFVNSMGDLFHESVPDEWIDRVFAVMALAPQHTFQVLTKRARRMREYLAARSQPDERGNPAEDIRVHLTAWLATPSWRAKHPAQAALMPLGKFCAAITWPLPNVWLGVTAEDQTRANERIPDLLATPDCGVFRSATASRNTQAITAHSASSWNGSKSSRASAATSSSMPPRAAIIPATYAARRICVSRQRPESEQCPIADGRRI